MHELELGIWKMDAFEFFKCRCDSLAVTYCDGGSLAVERDFAWC
jgi:hypothetical protein